VLAFPGRGLAHDPRRAVAQRRHRHRAGVLLAADWYFDFSAVMALMAPVILIGGMTMGLFTPTEAAVAAVIWSCSSASCATAR
jgi:TRAP-type C4-dicarboxylate transport system permease large subunit